MPIVARLCFLCFMLFHMLKTTFFAHACQQYLGHNAPEFSAALRFINTACACL